MSEKYTLEQHQAYVEAEEKRKAKEVEARNEKTEKESAKRAWMVDGGKAADFEKAWPQLRDQGRRQRVLDADKRAREEMTRSGVSRI
jgi:hypothetical protein